MIAFTDRSGRRAFAFEVETDPTEVLVELAWAWAERPSTIDHGWACPSHDGSYCVECHIIAYGAKRAAEARR